MTAEELLQHYAAGERDFRSSGLSYIGDAVANADLSNVNFSGLNLNDSYMEGVNLSGAMLT